MGRIVETKVDEQGFVRSVKVKIIRTKCRRKTYSKHPLIRTRTGPKNLFEIASSNYRMDFKRK